MKLTRSPQGHRVESRRRLGGDRAAYRQAVRRTRPRGTADGRSMSVIVWRDSVAMGDDADAPHEWVVALPAEATVANLVTKILRKGYLPRIGGGNATWIVEGRRPVAVLAQQWSEPRWLVDSDAPLTDLSRKAGRANFEIRYWCQVGPNRVYACLRDGRPLPERYRR